MDKDKLKALPQKPGVYIFKNSAGDTIYIGKAKVLRDRVGSYFGGSKKDLKTQIMASLVIDMDYVVTKNELEAFLLENSLIKEYKPKYNILLKDDKSYPYIKVTKEKYPGVYVTRMTDDKNALYFGPYYALETKRVVRAIYSIFKARQCTYSFDEKPLKRPCVFYDSGVCLAPCIRHVTDAEYSGMIKEVIDFLNGSYDAVKEKLSVLMSQYSAAQKYEQAAEARDAIKAIDEISIQQKVVGLEKTECDVFDFAYQNGTYYFCVLNIRRGRLINKKTDVFENTAKSDNAYETYLAQYYSAGRMLPEEIVIRKGAADTEVLINGVFSGKKIKLSERVRDSLLSMAAENIHEKIKQDEKAKESRHKSSGEFLKQLEALKTELKLEKLPQVIDGLDISHLHGENTVASCVVFSNGAPDKKNYRRYKIKTVHKIDDFDSMREVVMRRYGKMIQENINFPDLILIDGGIGQVNAAKEALLLVGAEDVSVIGLAKREELVFFPGKNEGIALSDAARFPLMRVRDEAHRFAITYQMTLSDKKLIKSVFDDIPGIGEKTKREIYTVFGTKEELLKAVESNDEKAKFLNKKQKEEIIKYFAKEN